MMKGCEHELCFNLQRSKIIYLKLNISWIMKAKIKFTQILQSLLKDPIDKWDTTLASYFEVGDIIIKIQQQKQNPNFFDKSEHETVQPKL
jgi:hypothetical protein